MSSPEPFVLPPLPFDPSQFENAISARTFAVHHDKHHKTYVDTANRLANNAGLANATPLEIIRRARDDSGLQSLFNNAAQAWNHSFYWDSLSAQWLAPEGDLAVMIARDFGNWDKFVARFLDAASSRFGSGWAWLVWADGKLDIVSTGNADTPIAQGGHPLLTLDVWEHAYYLDHENDRRVYAQAVIERHLNWPFAARNLAAL